jgi:hypothetical protein
MHFEKGEPHSGGDSSTLETKLDLLEFNNIRSNQETISRTHARYCAGICTQITNASIIKDAGEPLAHIQPAIQLLWFPHTTLDADSPLQPQPQCHCLCHHPKSRALPARKADQLARLGREWESHAYNHTRTRLSIAFFSNDFRRNAGILRVIKNTKVQ